MVVVVAGCGVGNLGFGKMMLGKVPYTPPYDLLSQARLRGLEQRSRINMSVRARKSVKRE
jgi:hypothetical protein